MASLSARFESAPQSGHNPDDDGNPPPERALVSLTESGRERGGSAARGSDCRGLKGPFIASSGSTSTRKKKRKTVLVYESTATMMKGNKSSFKNEHPLGK